MCLAQQVRGEAALPLAPSLATALDYILNNEQLRF